MGTVAIVGAGDLGGACAQALALSDRLQRIVLIDQAAAAAAGKALDIRQSGAIDGFHTELVGTSDRSRAAGCDACVIADRFGVGSPEWQADEGLVVLREVTSLCDAPVILAGATQHTMMRSAVRELLIPRRRIIGSTPEAFGAAVTAIVAMEAGCSPVEVSLAVIGAPPGLIVSWSGASIGGYPLERVLSQAQLGLVARRVDRLWPPGPYALGASAARVALGVLESSRRSYNVLTMLDGEFGVRNCVGALPALLHARGIAQTRVPALSDRERVQVESALGS